MLNISGDATGLTTVKTQRPISSDDEHVVLKFRPRTLAQPPGKREEAARSTRPASVVPASVANDLSRYEKPREEPDDFRQRMLANIAAFAFTVALTAIGIWLAMSIADLRKTQDCVLMGRRDCAKITVMPRS
ncbi:hypothetical protein [Bradyrhizobium sp. B120]|uniref:hypothetical protein n=1 Tax=Bradyrhizobium sp. B120 TaxID=3410088 RepID=UPI003B9839EC